MNIFIYGLNFKARREDLIELFSPYGEVTSARIIINRDTHRSRGYGFVEMSSDEAGNAAIAALNGTEHMGRVINVAVANERPPKKEE
ncbi:MAG: RNA-binding protein [Bacteroidales bacterium]|nr:RNA-binding protein [Bacteroidales bacterium]MDD3201614.1 RNA-binding protein [Bacteroidales bacterium]